MTKILVLYYSMYGHIETMAQAVADGASKVEGVEVTIKRVPETMPAEAFVNAGGKAQDTPVATPQGLACFTMTQAGAPSRNSLMRSSANKVFVHRQGHHLPLTNTNEGSFHHFGDARSRQHESKALFLTLVLSLDAMALALKRLSFALR